ncbi:Imm64 family immunity protein [Jeotgalibacillus malaysiensis]|uniref:Imm64 family immunity protein n=1 Tax=Jeotgalibacillus malaysiensis TaxID=1508404 RepID=UPI00384D515E
MGTGGYINIGIVFNHSRQLLEVFDSIKNELIEKGSSFNHVKYSKDIDGFEWVEQQIKNNVIHQSSFTGYYTKFILSGTFLNVGIHELSLIIHKEDQFFGFLFGINWEDVFARHILNTQSEMVDWLIELYQKVPYGYSFIGHEIEIEKHPNDFKTLMINNHSYPVSVIPVKGRLKIYYGENAIDGLSDQEQRIEFI